MTFRKTLPRPRLGWLLPAALALSACAAANAQQTLTFEGLKQGFARPPAESRLRCYWWWLNGNTDEATITHDLEEMKRKGFGGALLVDANGADQEGNASVPAGPTFASPAWTKLYVHALREADRLGLEISLNIVSGWNLGGPDVPPAEASKLLTWSRGEASGPHINVQVQAPAAKNGYYQQIAVLAYPLHHGVKLAKALSELGPRSAAMETGFSMPDATFMLDGGGSAAGDPDTSLAQVVDVSDHMAADGTLHWDAPGDGAWEILRIGYTDSGARVSTSSGAWQGLAVDYLDHTAFDAYWNRNVEPLMAVSKPYLGRSLKYLVTDSWELKGTNWTPAFRTKFKELRGYDPVPYLPVVAGRIVGDRDASVRFLTDLRRTVADLIVTEHYDVFAEHAARYGLGIHPESGGPHGAPIDALETFRSNALIQTEYWAPNAHRATDVQRFFAKEGASAAHIYGQRFVAMEGMTSIGPQWSERLSSDLKPAFDQAITEGMNRLIWHEFTSSPASTGLPGQEYFAGTHLNPKITWWNAGVPFFTYLNRAQFVMQQGVQVDDALFFYGDNVPNFVRVKADDPAKVLPGYDYDVTDEDALLRTIHTAHGELIGPSGMSWKVLVLPHSRRLSLTALQAIAKLVEGGATVVGESPLSPTGMVSAQARTGFDAQVKTIWGDCSGGGIRHVGKGTLFCGTDTRAALAAMKIQQDFTPDAAGASLDYLHRRAAGSEIYFIRNGSDHAVTSVVSLRAGGLSPQLWDAVSGTVTLRPAFSTAADGTVKLAVHLPAYGSIYVVCHGHASSPMLEPDATLVSTPLTGPWTLTFQPNRGAPEAPITLASLTSWSDSSDPGVRYFSGTATYKATFKAPSHQPGQAVYLRVAQVREIAGVKVNGQEAGALWAEPYQVRIDTLLHPGDNTLELEVTNLWPNRIIGDMQPGVSKTYTSTNIRKYTASSPLLPSGLIGEAELLTGAAEQ
jgi:hypothetical protein